MDQSSFGILAHNYLRTHNLVLVAHRSRVYEFEENAHKFQKIRLQWHYSFCVCWYRRYTYVYAI